MAESFTCIPPILSAGYTARRGANRESITEILAADLGDAVSQSPYLIVSAKLPRAPGSKIDKHRCGTPRTI